MERQGVQVVQVAERVQRKGKTMKTTTILTAMVSVLMVAATAQALEVLLDTSFETAQGYTTGPLVTGYIGDSGNQQGWYGEVYFGKYQSTNAATVTTDAAHSGLMSVGIPNEDYFYDYYRHAIPQKDTGFVTVEFWQMLESVTTDAHTCNNLSVGAFDRDGTNPSDPSWPYGGMGGQIEGHTDQSSGTVDANTPNSYTVSSGWADTYPNDRIGITETGVAAQGEWSGFRYRANLANGKMDMFVNTGSGWTQKLDDVDMWYRTAGAPNVIDNIWFYQISSGNYFTGDTRAFIDDMRVTWSVPEPGTLLLLVFGAAVSLSRRRR